jgi:uncharacterized protein involved in exopolysaccharide biosynthesis
MMTQDFVLSLNDLFSLYKRSKRKICYTIISFAVLGALFGLFRPIVYIAKGTFRDKATSESNTQDVSASLKILGLNETASEAQAWMKSRFLIHKLIKRLSLQAEVQKRGGAISAYFDRLRDNIKVEKAFWMKLKKPSLPDLEREIVVAMVDYREEFPTELSIEPIDAASYRVLDKKKILGVGQFGEPFQAAKFSFTLLADKKASPHQLVLWPQWKIADDFISNFLIKPDTKDKTLYNLTFADRDRYRASESINDLMHLYLDHMRYEHRFLLQEHLSYLQKRQDEMNQNLKGALEEHVSTLSTDLSTSGFPSTQSVIEYLSETSLQYTKNLHLIEMEITRLQNFRAAGLTYHDQYRSEDDPHTINAALAEIRQLKKQADVLELALKNNTTEQDIFLQRGKFADLMKEHQSVLAYSKEVKEMLEKLKGKLPLEGDYKLFQEPRYIAGVWNDRLQEIWREYCSVDHSSYRLCSSHFQLYLNNLEHFLDVYDKTLKERITHQQNPPDEWQGMNLQTAQEVYGGFCKSLGEIESSRRQFEYVLEQMENPAFEISSLSAVLEDPVSQRLIEKASQLELLLKEEGNRSNKEQERLKNELAGHRGFLQTHMHQSLELMKIREKLLHEKTYHLQQTTLELTQQQISILEKYLEDFIETRLANLEQEKQFIHQQQEKLNQEMGKIPAKWVSEKMIEAQVKTNQQLMAELTRLVENKNISTNLEAVRSTPVDLATPAVHPRQPRILLLAFLGGILGCFFSCFYLFGKAIIYGFPMSEDNLRLAKQHVSGSLRSLLAYFEAGLPSPSCRDLLLVLGRGSNYAPSLAELLAKMEYRVLILPLSFDLDSQPRINKKGSYDCIEAGRASQYTSELVATQRFQKFYNELKSHYDWVIAYTTALPSSAEAEAISMHFERIACTLDQEKMQELLPWMEGKKKITFLIKNSC